MRKSLVNLVSQMAVGAAILTGCGSPPVEKSTTIQLSLKAAAGFEDAIASKPRFGLLQGRETTASGRWSRLTVQELEVGGDSASDVTLDLARAKALPVAAISSAVLVLLAPDAPQAGDVTTPEDDLAPEVPGTDGNIVPSITAEQADALGVVAILPVYARHLSDVGIDGFGVFADARTCPEGRPVHPYRECPLIALDPGYHVGIFDAARENSEAIAAWNSCFDESRKDVKEGPFGFVDGDALADEDIKKCGEYPGNAGRVEHVTPGQKLSFEVGGTQDLLRTLPTE